MCYTCLLLYTPYPVVNDAVVAAYDAVVASGTTVAQRANSLLLHHSFGDMNVDDFFFDAVDDPERLAYLYSGADEWERALFDLLAPLSEAERVTVIAMTWGYVFRDGSLHPDVTSRYERPRRSERVSLRRLHR